MVYSSALSLFCSDADLKDSRVIMPGFLARLVVPPDQQPYYAWVTSTLPVWSCFLVTSLLVSAFSKPG